MHIKFDRFRYDSIRDVIRGRIFNEKFNINRKIWAGTSQVFLIRFVRSFGILCKKYERMLHTWQVALDTLTRAEIEGIVTLISDSVKDNWREMVPLDAKWVHFCQKIIVLGCID